MPCYTVQTMSVAFNVKSKERLLEALRQLGITWNIWREEIRAGGFIFDLATGKVTFPDRQYMQDSLNEIKKKYSFLTLQEVARKKKWAFRPGKVDQFKGQLVKI